MASTSEDWDMEKALAKWRQLGELGLEAGLREAGCSDKTIHRICDLDRSREKIEIQDLNFDFFSSEQRAAFLAMVGRAGSSVKSLNFSTTGKSERLTQNDAAALCANLTSNTNIKELSCTHHEVFGTVKGCTLFGHALRTNSALQILEFDRVKMDDHAVKFLMDGLQENKTLFYLSLYGNPLSEEGMRSVADFVASNTTLPTLDMREMSFGFKSASYISSALGRNSTLDNLQLGSYSKPFERDALMKLLEPFSEDIGDEIVVNTSKNTTIKNLGLWSLVSGNVAELKLMIRMNKSLSTLELRKAQFKPEDWRDEIFPALKENNSIQKLDLSSSKGLQRKDVKDALMDLLQSSNIGLTTVDLSNTDISNLQGRVNEELRLNSEYRTRLQGQATVQTMAGRLILCGFGYAGKTTISETMEGICHRTAKSRYNSFKRKINQTFPRLRQIFFGSDAYTELASRTRGFNVVSLDTEGYLKSIWDFAGQKAYYALHDYLFPNNKNSCFLYVSSSRCPPTAQDRMGTIKSEEKIRTECEYWMKFIASNAKPRLAGDRNENHLPQVRFVMTHKDTLTPPQLRTSKQWAQRVVRDLKDVFKDVLELCETVEVVNAYSCEDVRHLVTLTEESLAKILEHQREYTICQDLRNVLAQQPVGNHVMSLDDFYNLREGRFSFGDSPIMEAVIAYLNDSGEVIFPKGFEFYCDKSEMVRNQCSRFSNRNLQRRGR